MYAVEYVGDEDLPTNQAWAMIRQGSRVCLFLKESAVCPLVLEEAWAGYRSMLSTGQVPTPCPLPQVSGGGVGRG